MQSPEEFLALQNIFRIKVHTPYPVGPVNAYLIKKRPYTLIDSGPDTDEGRETLLSGLEKAGVKPEEIERVIITHNHSDHSGLANWLNRISGAQIFVHRLEVRKMQNEYIYYQENLPFLHEAGLPQYELNNIINDIDPVPRPVLPNQGVTLLSGGELLEYADMKLRIHHLPGHCGGHICLHDEENHIFFAGDLILKHITPNPLMEAIEPDLKERLPVLSQYINSVNIFGGLSVKIALPGHGSFIQGNRDVAARAVRHHQDRLEHYLAVMDGKEYSVYELMRVLYPRVKGFQIYLALSEVNAHLDYLFSRGTLNSQEKQGVFYYSTLPDSSGCSFDVIQNNT